ncbi:hypothetical protein SAMN04488028_101168 [Reichenbachiella agariperforans]|uniref:Uncharacterized protein n=1 Tax=Reichenbachiella agariperforans TaxID=156994 RepID=A0A1M6JEY7_REIAG|nr:hypothetical protein [Reichenbachiella agariperforans]SHJ45258.1 hypothetical protein SAMN04488028_101168 [Reichenbachiella agariperforans]
MRKVLPLLIVLISLSTLSFAQETPEEDPFADYSYLWEDTKKDKKKKKKKNKETNTAEQVAPAAAVVADTTKVKPETITVDSLSQTAVADSLASEELIIPTDTVVQDSYIFVDSTTLEEGPTTEELAALEAQQAAQDSTKQAQKAAKREERKDKDKDKEPAEDFRAGLPPVNNGSAINGGFTYTVIDGKSYAGLVLAPELSLGKVGVGLDVPILYGIDDQSIRTEMYEDGVGALRLLSYVRYGQQKVDPVYVKVGSLPGTMIGYGGLVNNYSNSISYEKRKIGLHYDINVKGLAGIEGMYSDFDPSSFNLFAVRPYVRPLSWTFVPIVRSLEIGATYLSDHDQTHLLGTGDTNATYAFTKDGISAFNVDAGLTLLRVPFIQIDLFANYSKLNVSTPALLDSIDAQQTAGELTMPSDEFTDGSGISAGFNFRFHFIADLLSTDLRIERLSYSDYYLPQFFDTSYEIDKDGKLLSLASVEKMQGIYGSITGHILQKVNIGGSLLLPDHIGEAAPAVVTLTADVDRLFDKVSIHAKYFKGGLTELNDAFTLDERSLAKVRFVYHLNRFIVAGVDYFYTFTPTENGYETTQYISPYFGLSIQF